VLKNARNWHNENRNGQARAQFESALQSVLTAQQQSQLASARQLLAGRMVEMAVAEAEALE